MNTILHTEGDVLGGEYSDIDSGVHDNKNIVDVILYYDEKLENLRLALDEIKSKYKVDLTYSLKETIDLLKDIGIGYRSITNGVYKYGYYYNLLIDYEPNGTVIIRIQDEESGNKYDIDRSDFNEKNIIGAIWSGDFLLGEDSVGEGHWGVSIARRFVGSGFSHFLYELKKFYDEQPRFEYSNSIELTRFYIKKGYAPLNMFSSDKTKESLVDEQIVYCLENNKNPAFGMELEYNPKRAKKFLGI